MHRDAFVEQQGNIDAGNGEALVSMRAIQKSYDGRTLIVANLDLEIRRGEFLTLLGPSGSGKTTCLMMLAGFETPTSGEIRLDGKIINRLPPHKRDIGMVFQNYALFPHMTVAENVAYGPKVRGVKPAERRKLALEILELVRLETLAERSPSQLSGGQKQRVALARALVNRPKVLLLDEPLGALDLRLREEMQTELKSLQQRLGITFLYVTHDQGEALSMADRIAVFREGRIEQLDTPRGLYVRPKTAFVARFVGSANVVAADAATRLTGLAQAFAIRPELIEVLTADRAAPEGSLGGEGVLEDVQYHGATSRWLVRLDAGPTLTAACPESGMQDRGIKAGSRVRLAWSPDSLVALADA